MHGFTRSAPNNARPRWAAFAVALVSFIAAGGPACAHPLGNFPINHLVKIRQSGDALQIRYVLDMAEIPTFSVMRSRSADGRLAGAGLQAWADAEVPSIAGGLDVRADDVRYALQAIGEPIVRTRPGAGGLPTIYWVEDFLARPSNVRKLTVDDRTFPDRIGWKDIVVGSDAEPTSELTHYPIAMLTSPRDVTSIALTRDSSGQWIGAASAVANAVTTAPPPSQARSNALADMLARGPSSLIVVLLTLLAAIGLGALHALEPGHGKTLLAVSLVGARATPRQALVLAAALTLAHTAGVLCLGVALLLAAPWIVPETVYPWLTVASGLAVACLGASALTRFVRVRRGEWPTIKVGTTEHGHPTEHGHAHDGDRPTIKVGPTEHGHPEEQHGHNHVIPGDAPISFRGVVMIAMSGNVAPCPAALVVMLAALASHQLGYGLAIIVAFGIGLAATLTGLGIAVVRGASIIARRPAVKRIVAFGPLASACAISFIGALMFGQGIASSIIRAPGWPVTLLTLGAIAGYAMRPGHTHAHVPLSTTSADAA